jgi:hypothetical protein
VFSAVKRVTRLRALPTRDARLADVLLRSVGDLL